MNIKNLPNIIWSNSFGMPAVGTFSLEVSQCTKSSFDAFLKQATSNKSLEQYKIN